MNKKAKTIIWIVLGIALIASISIMIVGLWNCFGGTQELTFDAFYGKVAAGEINELYVDAYNWTGKVVIDGKVTDTYTAVGPTIYDYEGFKAFIAKLNPEVARNLSVQFSDPNAGWIRSVWISAVFVMSSLIGMVVFSVLCIIDGKNKK